MGEDVLALTYPLCPIVPYNDLSYAAGVPMPKPG